MAAQHENVPPGGRPLQHRGVPQLSLASLAPTEQAGREVEDPGTMEGRAGRCGPAGSTTSWRAGRLGAPGRRLSAAGGPDPPRGAAPPTAAPAASRPELEIRDRHWDRSRPKEVPGPRPAAQVSSTSSSGCVLGLSVRNAVGCPGRDARCARDRALIPPSRDGAPPDPVVGLSFRANSKRVRMGGGGGCSILVA